MKPATSKAKSPADTAAKPETSETPTSHLATAPAVSPDALSEICYCRIFPSIGIARIGNSPDSYFVASEAPGHWESPVGGYKDPHGRIKRQAARFRIYAFNAKDEVVAELTSAEADIAWTVHLANKKADWYEFQGGMPAPTKDKTDQRAITKTIPRNIVVPGNPGEASRAALVIDPGPRFIQGSKSGPVLFDSGTFGPLPQIPSPKPSDVSDTFLATFDNGVRPADAVPPLPLIPPASATGYEMTPQKTVLLGELQTDEGGRLLVLGGKGDSASLWNTGIGVYPHWTDFDTEYYFANNDFWHDDTSDGPVNATVRLRNGGRELEVRDGAWVVVAPPKFAPAHVNLTSLYDLAQEIARQKWPTEVPTPPEVSFTRDIYPILARLDQLQWVNVSAFEGHGTGTVRDFLGRTWFPFLQSNEQAPDSRSAQLRAKIFGRIRNPKYTKDYRELSPEKASAEANLSYMPQIWGDNGQIYEADHPVEGDPGTFQTLLLSQYALLERWKNGDFIADWSGFRLRQHALNEVEKQYPNANLGTLLASLVGLVFHDRELFRAAIEAKGENLTKAQVDLLLFHSVDGRAVPQRPSFDQIPLARQPAALTEAALEPCVGGPFYPGIEATYIMTFFESWSGPFRLNATQYRPGDITKHMALPWQADFFECNLHWWPAQRPDDIVPESEYREILKTYDSSLDRSLASTLGDRVLWTRGLPDPVSDSSYPAGDDMMVKRWHELGFVVPEEYVDKKTGAKQIVYIETERDPYAIKTDRDYFYLLMNIGSFPDFLPTAKRLTHQFLAQAWRNQEEADPDERWKFFRFTAEAFDARMEQIYNNFVHDSESESVYYQQLFKTRDLVIKNLVNFAPFNQLDGTWLRHATPAGPIDDVQSMLFNIYMDEMGDGDPAQNHANVYTDLLKSVGIYLPDLHTRAYADYPGIIDSAYTLPVFLLAITQFPEDFYPELLGMTLQLEWEAVSLMPIVDGLRAFGIDPHYYVLHVGIDNAASGHGAVAKQAVKIYLDTIRENEGDARMQEVWKRIWTGYVAFGTIGSMGSDLDNQARMGAGLEDQMIAMINVKAPYARRNHRTKKLGPNYINDWFDDPKGLLNELIKSGMVVPGRPDLSPMLNLMGFNGPMYKVFTDKEQDLWRNWIISLNPPPPAPGLHEQMLTLIKKLRERQQGTTGHNVQLQGPDPKNPGKEITMPLHAWFNLNQDPSIPDPEIALMRALKHPANGWIVPHSVVASPFVTSLLAGTNAMAVAFQDMMPDSSGMTYKEVIVKWIEKGCRTEPLVKSTLRSAVDMENRIIPSKPLRKIWGQGRVH